MGMSVSLRVVPSSTGLPSKRCPGVRFLSIVDREFGIFQHMAPTMRLLFEFPHETGLIQVSLYFFLVFYLTSQLCFFVQLQFGGPSVLRNLFVQCHFYLIVVKFHKENDFVMFADTPVFKHIAWPLS